MSLRVDQASQSHQQLLHEARRQAGALTRVVGGPDTVGGGHSSAVAKQWLLQWTLELRLRLHSSAPVMAPPPAAVARSPRSSPAPVQEFLSLLQTRFTQLPWYRGPAHCLPAHWQCSTLVAVCSIGTEAVALPRHADPRLLVVYSSAVSGEKRSDGPRHLSVSYRAGEALCSVRVAWSRRRQEAGHREEATPVPP